MSPRPETVNHSIREGHHIKPEATVMNAISTPAAHEPDLFTRKFRLWASCFDADRDFHLTRDDFARTADRWSAAVGLPGDAELTVQMRNTLRKVWDTAVSPDGRYDNSGAGIDEVVVSMRQVLAAPNHPATATFIDFAGLCFLMCDRDGDGYISEAEFVTPWHHGLLVAREPAIAAFRYADTKGDGRITAEDLLRVSLEFLSTDDPTSPAASLVGQLHNR
ncbi:EF-hand domain-containing protein [Streptomyces sp. URMC 127]|uniref:EF-hand domain-containing protein n=1 Tax=Streptomyces sp. URMC 127 TaxID=3423402 RepID=UPI003F1D3D74